MNDKETKILKDRLKDILEEFWENKLSEKNKKCYICKNEIKEDFAKSHSIPKFILKYIANERYEVKTRYNDKNLRDQPRIERIKSAARFKNVCRNCESILFKNYEKFLEDYEKFLNDENKNILNDEILSEINLKIYLKETYELKKAFFQDSELDTIIEKVKEDEVIRRIDDFEINRDNMLELTNFQKKKWKYLTEKLDKTVEKNLQICNQKIKKETDKRMLDYLEKRKIILEKYKRKDLNYTDFSYNFHIIDLKYRVPLSIQCLLDLQEMITVIDVLGVHRMEFVEDRESYIPVSICVFPLENTTRIFLFSENKNELFKIFKQEFKKYSQDMQLKFINYMIFKTTNTYYYSPLIDSSIEDKIRKIINNKIMDDKDGRILIISDGLEEIEKEIQEIPNLLSKNYSIKELEKKYNN